MRCTPALAASRMIRTALATPPSRSRNTGAACTAAALTRGCVIAMGSSISVIAIAHHCAYGRASHWHLSAESIDWTGTVGSTDLIGQSTGELYPSPRRGAD